ncbi:MAG TPA: hypothetical protein VNN55_09325 [bacterium]|nr:hypothetical protein [bacterium]
MPERRAPRFAEWLDDAWRALVGWTLAILMIPPALVIRAADGVTAWWIRRRGGLD